MHLNTVVANDKKMEKKNFLQKSTTFFKRFFFIFWQFVMIFWGMYGLLQKSDLNAQNWLTVDCNRKGPVTFDIDLPEKPSSLLSEGRKLCVSWKLIDLRLWTRMKMTLVLLKIMLGIIKGIVKNFSNPVVFALTIAPVTQRFLSPWMACDWLAIFFMSYRYQPTHCCSFKYFARRIHLRFSRLLWPPMRCGKKKRA